VLPRHNTAAMALHQGIESSGFGSSKMREAKFWLRVMNELKNRGVEDVLIAVIDGLKGFPEAITAVFPLATVQTCIVASRAYRANHGL
jgi:putative transposase